ncbi:class I SAM-dependent methyltransferase [Halobacteriovorax sp. GB3]|uniref:class I SAM-dependent methyltransferase n=1 Tax=Halobacteriovorax sp. GB3 TaxID=2719615 RepID=UPI00236059F3|nr:class I SAM-dependent methyltransferase [Halobacteriovorax sp. GB3]MDD0852378.1 class I SAM-dependent methyltransferase [Halobacteriovorax sp. GB3]
MSEQSKKDQFDLAFKNKQSPYEAAKSLTKLLCGEVFERLSSTIKDHPRVLEIGCGDGAVIKDIPNKLFKNCDYLGIDLSTNAIGLAIKNNPSFNFQNVDILNFESSRQFDIIIDSHCLHFLTEALERKRYFSKVSDLLKDEGLYVVETMLLPKKAGDVELMSFDFQSNCFVKDGRKVIFLDEARHFEEIFSEYDLEIQYFYCPLGAKFICESHRSESLISDPDVLRAIVKKKSGT